jgi:spore coat polysaccharide biosynthesis protein SpsF
MKAGVLVFSRMSSSRLPGKALLPLGNKCLVERVLLRAGKTGLPIALATSVEKEDDVLADFVQKLGYPVFRGSLDNVLERAVQAAESFSWDAFFRLCGDRPFFDFKEMIEVVECFVKPSDFPKFDLITNWDACLPKGLMMEFVKTQSLKKVLMAKDLRADHQEHLTAYFYERRADFEIHQTASPHVSEKGICLAVDEVEDYNRLLKVSEMDPDIYMETYSSIASLKMDLGLYE